MKNQPNPVRSVAAGLLLLAVSGALAGCRQEIRPGLPKPFLPRPKELTRLGRVVMLELAYDGPHPALQQAMTSALVSAMRDRGLFHIETVGRDDPRVREASANLKGRKTFEDLAALRKTLGCDALLIGTIHHFEPYPHMQVGLYLQLLDLRNGRLIWGLEHLWDTSDRATEQRVRAFFHKRMRKGYGPLDWRLATVSPKAFGKYVACEVAAALEPPPEPTPSPS